jgi:hypothetical protein
MDESSQAPLPLFHSTVPARNAIVTPVTNKTEASRPTNTVEATRLVRPFGVQKLPYWLRAC